MKIYCCWCKKEVDARLVNGKTIYPHRHDLFSKKFYMCPDCGQEYDTSLTTKMAKEEQ